MFSSATTSPEQVVRDMFQALDALEFAQMHTYLADDAQRVDETTGEWQRGREAIQSSFDQMKGVIQRVESRLSSIEPSEWGDAALVTCDLQQTYEIGGETQKIHAPTSVVFRRQDGEWKIVLFHSLPLPEPSPA